MDSRTHLMVTSCLGKHGVTATVDFINKASSDPNLRKALKDNNFICNGKPNEDYLKELYYPPLQDNPNGTCFQELRYPPGAPLLMEA